MNIKSKTINVDFVRFKTTDNIELRGWLTNKNSNTAAIHIHGMSGNGYENYFLDNLREMFSANNISFFAIDTRGSGIINSFWKDGEEDNWGEGTKHGGSCFEIFKESESDIQGAIDYLKSLGKTKFILLGHSLGASKVVNYLVSKNKEKIISSILLAPTDMVSWAETDPKNNEYLQKAKELLSKGKNEELVASQCWLDKTPLSAQTYPSITEAGTKVDIYGIKNDNAPLGKITIPTLIVYGDIDIGITMVDKTVEKYIEKVNKIKNENTKICIIKNASHSFKMYEDELALTVENFIKKSVK